MAEPKFTPGPWSTDRWGCVRGGEFRQYARGMGQSQLASATLAENISPEQRDANARLIAAAPDMYEALRDVEWAIDGFCPQCGRSRKVGHQEKCALAKALAKARGEAK